ncbi:hypothetical protein QQS21_002758 [Conoideocrella luteorostrata]|uniref:S1-like domain-containing protein n=1 Tax=Conoideocrella luteorostrata TaxID=1105319 RepID=A0AAJ0CUF2_9HYPO|nr:hypothetical protein QQS21_002758 [Conoideocrella luteorostrata]
MGKPKRNVLAAAEETLNPPDSLEVNQSLVRVVKPEGNNLYTCELPNQKPVVLELAQRFRNTIWIKRGGYVLAERYTEGSNDGRAGGEIVNVVRDEKLWRKQPYWYEKYRSSSTSHFNEANNISCVRPKEFTRNTYELNDEEDDSNVGKMPPSDSEED